MTPCIWCSAPQTKGCVVCVDHVEKWERQERERREEEATERRREWLTDIGVPRALHGIRFADLERTRPVEVMEAYAHSDVKRGCACGVLGPTGVGKTRAGIGLLSEMLPDFRNSQRYELGLTLVRELHNFDTCDDALERCLRPTLLVIDDLPRVRDERVAEAIEETSSPARANGAPPCSRAM